MLPEYGRFNGGHFDILTFSNDAGNRMKTKLPGSCGTVKVLYYTSQLKNGTNCEKKNIFARRQLAHKICRGFKVHDMIKYDSKVQVVV